MFCTLELLLSFFLIVFEDLRLYFQASVRHMIICLQLYGLWGVQLHILHWNVLYKLIQTLLLLEKRFVINLIILDILVVDEINMTCSHVDLVINIC